MSILKFYLGINSESNSINKYYIAVHEFHLHIKCSTMEITDKLLMICLGHTQLTCFTVICWLGIYFWHVIHKKNRSVFYVENDIYIKLLFNSRKKNTFADHFQYTRNPYIYMCKELKEMQNILIQSLVM